MTAPEEISVFLFVIGFIMWDKNLAFLHAYLILLHSEFYLDWKRNQENNLGMPPDFISKF